MKLNLLVKFQKEWVSFSSQSRLFLLYAMLCSFFISADYAVIRPVSNAVFLTAYGTVSFPYAWMLTIPFNFFVVALYNKYLPKVGCWRMFLNIAVIIAVSNLFCFFFLTQLPWLPFLFYIWKEIYILLMFQQLWSVIHSVVSLSKAKYLYGILFGVGGLGAIAGSMLPSFLAVKVGSEALLLATLPLYGFLTLFFFCALKKTEEGIEMRLSDKKQRTSLQAFWHGMQLIGKSRYLTFILLIVVLMQVCSSLIDYQFNSLLETTIPTKDLRTQFTGRIFAIVHSLTVVLQFFGSFLLIQLLGVKRSHFLIPCLLCLNSIVFDLFPLFAVASFAYISIKSCDFSLFGIVKEMLYIPLHPDEKFRAKAVIDVFAYRSSKALASLLILGLQAFFTSHILTVLNWSGILLLSLWIFIVIYLFKEPVITASQE